MPQQIPDKDWLVSSSQGEHLGSGPVASTHKERPSTPPNCTGQLSSLSASTPLSHNVSSYVSTSDRSHLKLCPFLDHDIKNLLITSFEDFLQDVFEFKASTDVNLEEICQHDETRRLFGAFLLTLDQPEYQRYKPFTDLANYMSSLIAHKNGRECTIFTRRHDHHGVANSSKTTRFPDVVFASKPENISSNPLHWSDIKLVLEFKVKSPPRNAPSTQPGISLPQSSASAGSQRRPAVSASDNVPNKSPRIWTFQNSRDALQLASYALESFSHGPYRSHIVHGMIQGSALELWYYDRVGAMRSEAVDFAKNPIFLAQFLMAIAHLSEAGWGLHPRITYPQLTPLSRSPSFHCKSQTPNSTDDKGPSLDIKSHDSVHGSSCQSTPEHPLDRDEPFRGATITIQGREFVLGVCCSRQYSLVGRGTCVMEANEGTVVVKLSWPEKTRTPEYEFLERAYASAMEYDDGKYAGMKDHLPVLVAKEDFGEWEPRSRILARGFTLDSSGRGSRILRVTVYQKLVRMIEIRTADDLMTVMRDIALCHRWLYRVMGIVHRDITMDNIMFRRNGDQIIGVLIDYDLAIDINKPSTRSLERTGVRHYMAIDLIEGTPIPHHARHDMESMFWVLVWFTFRHQDGKEIRATSSTSVPLQNWITDGALDVSKRAFFNKTRWSPTTPFTDLDGLYVEPLTSMFSLGHRHLGLYDKSMYKWIEHNHGPGPKLADKPAFAREEVFYDDTSMWIAFFKVLNPTDPVEFDDVCNSARLGFWAGPSDL
ncbi:hypothetical protein BS47DRAFT_1395854 [Hydnum rufescens UP504]|uniref:Fungal-type protein kinase domain-containing protein n=1 Tax=Hydnum rufescens UP504 TaxID=1448309 RepID=A0A9P6ARA3_9AGAM|nr:hypothetical protein BS47DRAFT_1395854 [Hydnum rufescens UP504]